MLRLVTITGSTTTARYLLVKYEPDLYFSTFVHHPVCCG